MFKFFKLAFLIMALTAFSKNILCMQGGEQPSQKADDAQATNDSIKIGGSGFVHLPKPDPENAKLKALGDLSIGDKPIPGDRGNQRKNKNGEVKEGDKQDKESGTIPAFFTKKRITVAALFGGVVFAFFYKFFADSQNFDEEQDLGEIINN